MAKEAGAMITFDPNLRRPLWSSMELAREQMLWGLRHADVVKIGQDELEFIFEGQDFKDSAKKLVEDFGVKLVFATMGKEGCYFINRQSSGQVPTFQEVKTKMCIRDSYGSDHTGSIGAYYHRGAAAVPGAGGSPLSENFQAYH